MSLVSVVVPTYNRACFLPGLLSSLRAQTHSPIEVVVVDDGSTDDTRSVVERWSSKNGHGLSVRYFHQSNQGAPSARNRGFNESTGDFIQFLDSDDLLHPQKLRIQAEALKKYSLAEAIWGRLQFFQDGTPPEIKEYDVDNTLKSAVVKKIVKPGQAGHPECPLYRREAVSKIGPWNEKLERWQDWEYCFRVVSRRLTKVQVPATFYFAREHEQASIGDLAESPRAVEICLSTLSAIDKVVGDMKNPQDDVYHTAFRLYLSVLRYAFREGARGEVRECFEGARFHSVGTKRRLQVNVLQKIYELFGPKVAGKFQDTYSLIKTRRVPSEEGLKS